MLKKGFAVVMLFASIGLLLLGCTDYEAIQKSVMQGIAKQKEVKSYSFEGTAHVKIDSSSVKSTNPLTAGLIGTLTQSEISWSGAANADPAQLEASIKLTPTGGSAVIEIPVLIKDNKMYFHIPAISKDKQYYSIDLKAGGSVAAGNLQQAASSLSDAFGLIAGAAKPNWFEETKGSTKLADGSSGRKITLNITDKNVQEFNASLQTKLPEIADKLQASGLITANTALSWKKADGSQKLALKAPGKLEFVLDQQGFIREQSCELTVTIAGDNGSTATHSITQRQSYNNINQPPAFSMQVPTDAKPFEDVLKLLKP
jgi:hypothetical protein